MFDKLSTEPTRRDRGVGTPRNPLRVICGARGALRARTVYNLYLLLESWEIELARQRFGDRSATGRLDRPPVKQWNFSNGMVALYEADR
jgi:hypothetical protein